MYTIELVHCLFFVIFCICDLEVYTNKFDGWIVEISFVQCVCDLFILYSIDKKFKIKNKKKLLCATQVLIRRAKLFCATQKSTCVAQSSFFFVFFSLLLFWFSFRVLALPFSFVTSTYVNVLKLRSNWFIGFIYG